MGSEQGAANRPKVTGMVVGENLRKEWEQPGDKVVTGTRFSVGGMGPSGGVAWYVVARPSVGGRQDGHQNELLVAILRCNHNFSPQAAASAAVVSSLWRLSKYLRAKKRNKQQRQHEWWIGWFVDLTLGDRIETWRGELIER